MIEKMGNGIESFTINGKEFPVVGTGAEIRIGPLYPMTIEVSPEVAREVATWVKNGHSIITIPSYPECPECGATGEDDWDYCPYDGARLDPAGEPTQYEVDRYGRRVGPVDAA